MTVDTFEGGRYVRAADYDALARELTEAQRDFGARMQKALLVNEQRLDELAEAHSLLREAPGMQWKSDVEYADWRRRINEHLGGESEDNR